ELDVGALDREHADRLVVAVGDQGEIAGLVDREAGRLLADLDRGDAGGRVRREVDHVELVVGRRLPVGAVLHPVDRVRDDRHALVRRDRQVHGRTEDRVHQRQRGDDLRRLATRDVDDRDRVLAWRDEAAVALGIERHLLVVADDHELGEGRRGGRREGRQEAGGGDGAANGRVHYDSSSAGPRGRDPTASPGRGPVVTR